LEAIPLGGIGEVSMNSMIFKYGSKAILVDCGIYFPSLNPFGVEIAFPDFSIIKRLNIEILAVVLTHGHEDHIGSLKFFLKMYPSKVFASNFTIKLLEKKSYCQENIQEFLPGDTFNIGPFNISTFPVSHSILEAVSLGIEIKDFRIFFTGDFKDDPEPIYANKTSWEDIKSFSNKGIDCLFSDSTNSLKSGATPSESLVFKNLKEQITKASGKIFLSCFSSHLQRINSILTISKELKKKVLVLGKSMRDILEIGFETGYLSGLESLLINKGDLNNLARDKTLILCSGSQGENRSTLYKVAFEQEKNLIIEEGDTLILSAITIPGNELSVINVINSFIDQGAIVITPKQALIHCSGHACQKDQEEMIKATNPRYFVPIHGNLQMLRAHGKTAENLGLKPQNLKFIRDGKKLSLSPEKKVSLESIKEFQGSILYDHNLGHNIELDVLKERKKLAFAGIISCFLKYDYLENLFTAEIKTKGYFLGPQKREFEKSIENYLVNFLQNQNSPPLDSKDLKELVSTAVRRYMKKKFSLKPLILIHLDICS